MKIVKYDPKEIFGLVYKVYPFLKEDDTEEEAEKEIEDLRLAGAFHSKTEAEAT